ncbi:hypothetical protein ATANTOWER_031381 [Ataeniobius toweri]|uniref:Uncharacterized protein n=1 Tax=Ataeniobius toweri TaxID=208326 RepID=A0ABU7AKY0_9TELE|nr:hypothetical protein [Ataeniobius toweri]
MNLLRSESAHHGSGCTFKVTLLLEDEPPPQSQVICSLLKGFSYWDCPLFTSIFPINSNQKSLQLYFAPAFPSMLLFCNKPLRPLKNSLIVRMVGLYLLIDL